MYIRIHPGSGQGRCRNSEPPDQHLPSSQKLTYVRVVQVNGREKTSPTGQRGGRVRHTTQTQTQPTTSSKPVNTVFGMHPTKEGRGPPPPKKKKTDLSRVLCARDEEPAAWRLDGGASPSLVLPFPVQHDHLCRILVV